MSQSASQAAAFYRDVAEHGKVWVLGDGEGNVAITKTSDGDEVTPVWSSESRLRKTLPRLDEGFQQDEPTEMSWDDFCDLYVEEFDADGVLLGINWSGENATGYDIPAKEVVANVEAAAESG